MLKIALKYSFSFDGAIASFTVSPLVGSRIGR